MGTELRSGNSSPTFATIIPRNHINCAMCQLISNVGFEFHHPGSIFGQCLIRIKHFILSIGSKTSTLCTGDLVRTVGKTTNLQTRGTKFEMCRDGARRNATHYTTQSTTSDFILKLFSLFNTKVILLKTVHCRVNFPAISLAPSENPPSQSDC